MSKRTVFTAFVAFMTIALLNMTMGCSEGRTTGESLVTNCDGDVSGSSNEALEAYGSLPLGVTLDNGVDVTILAVSPTAQGFAVAVRYADDLGVLVDRRLEVCSSLTRVEMLTIEGASVYGYEIALGLEPGTWTLEAWTPEDRLSATNYTTELRARYDIDGDVVDVSFADSDEMERAVHLHDQFGGAIPPGAASGDQELVAKVDAVLSLFAVHDSFEDNLDAEVASYLMANRDFVRCLIGDPDEVLSDHIVCHIAAVATLSCFCLPVCVVLCIPATGTSIACAVGGILNAIFS